MRARFLAILICVCPMALSPLACTAQSRTLGADERPGDFTLGVVHRRDGADARYVIDASGTLRASFGEGSGLATNPGYTRSLTADQLDELWRAAVEIDAPRAGNSERSELKPGEPEPQPKSADRVIVELSGSGTRRVLVLDTLDPLAAFLLARLESFSWADRP